MRHPFDDLIGSVVWKVGRVHYTWGDEITWHAGELEIRFDDGRIILIDVNSQDDALEVHRREWIDPYGGDLSEETLQFVNDHGRPVHYDVSADEPYARLVGCIVERVVFFADPPDWPRPNVLQMWVGGTLMTCTDHVDGVMVEIEPM